MRHFPFCIGYHEERLCYGRSPEKNPEPQYKEAQKFLDAAFPFGAKMYEAARTASPDKAPNAEAFRDVQQWQNAFHLEEMWSDAVVNAKPLTPKDMLLAKPLPERMKLFEQYILDRFSHLSAITDYLAKNSFDAGKPMTPEKRREMINHIRLLLTADDVQRNAAVSYTSSVPEKQPAQFAEELTDRYRNEELIYQDFAELLKNYPQISPEIYSKKEAIQQALFNEDAPILFALRKDIVNQDHLDRIALRYRTEEEKRKNTSTFLAKASLNERYKGENSSALYEDYADILKRNPTVSSEHFSDREFLLTTLGDQESSFIAALRLGVISDETLTQLAERHRAIAEKKAEIRQETTAEIDSLQRDFEKKERLGISETILLQFERLSPLQQFIVGSVALFAGWKLLAWKPERNIGKITKFAAFALPLFYLTPVRKMFDGTPIGDALGKVESYPNQGLDWMAGRINQNGASQETLQKYVAIMDGIVGEKTGREATAMTALSNVNLATLARNFDFNESHTGGTLRMDGAMKQEVEKIYGASAQSEEVIRRTQEDMCELGDVSAHVFFLLGALKHPTTYQKLNQSRLTLGLNAKDGQPAEFDDLKGADGEACKQLARQGKELAQTEFKNYTWMQILEMIAGKKTVLENVQDAGAATLDYLGNVPDAIRYEWTYTFLPLMSNVSEGAATVWTEFSQSMSEAYRTWVKEHDGKEPPDDTIIQFGTNTLFYGIVRAAGIPVGHVLGAIMWTGQGFGIAAGNYKKEWKRIRNQKLPINRPPTEPDTLPAQRPSAEPENVPSERPPEAPRAAPANRPSETPEQKTAERPSEELPQKPADRPSDAPNKLPAERPAEDKK